MTHARAADLKVNGNDLIAIGFEPGKRLGDILRYLIINVLLSIARKWYNGVRKWNYYHDANGVRRGWV